MMRCRMLSPQSSRTMTQNARTAELPADARRALAGAPVRADGRMNTGKEERREVARRHAFARPALLRQPGAQPGHADPAQVLHRPAHKALRISFPPKKTPNREMHSDGLPRRCAFRGSSTRFAWKHGAISPSAPCSARRRSPPALSFTSRFSFLQQSRPDTDSRPGPFPRRSPRSAPSLRALSIKPADNQPLKINIFLFFPALLFSGIDVQKS